MDWALVSEFAKWLFGGWLLLLFGFVVARMLSGHIIMTGLLSIEKRAPFGFDRLQLVFVTVLFAAGYLIAALARDPELGLPRIPTPLLLVLIGSNGTYLAVKYNALINLTGRGK